MLWAVYGVILATAFPMGLLRAVHPDVGLTAVQMIQRRGYPVEVHESIQTSDGYLLDIHRIPHGRNNAGQTKKPVVFLMHGLLSNSAVWVNMGPDKSIAYQLVEAGYDVWMGNARGNSWARKHITLNPNTDSKFWDFSWHEIGIIDLPTMIDYVLNVTGQSKLFYIGHSQGATSFFVMGSERPQYNNKIQLMVALAPLAYASHMTNPFCQILGTFHNLFEWILSLLGVDELLPSTDLIQLIGQTACNDESLFQEVCASIIFLIVGWNSAQLNQTMIPVITSNLPAGASTMQFVHYFQLINSGKFRQYDHGFISNLKKYGSISPPDYNTKGITAPVALTYSENDWLASIEDVNQLANELPNLVTSYLVPDPKFNHIDYIAAIDCRELLYNWVLSLLEKYQ